MVEAVGNHHAIDNPPRLAHTGLGAVEPDLEQVPVHGGPTQVVEADDTVSLHGTRSELGTPDVAQVSVRPDDLRDQDRLVSEVFPDGPFVRFT